MKHRFVLDLAILAASAGLILPCLSLSAALGQSLKEEHAKLQGTWTLLSHDVEGKRVRDRDAKTTMIIKGNKWISKWAKEDGGEQVEQGNLYITEIDKLYFKVDLVRTAGLDKGRITQGIMQVESGKLRYCYDDPRPAEFSTREGLTKRGLTVYERQKK